MMNPVNMTRKVANFKFREITAIHFLPLHNFNGDKKFQVNGFSVPRFFLGFDV